MVEYIDVVFLSGDAFNKFRAAMGDTINQDAAFTYLMMHADGGPECSGSATPWGEGDTVHHIDRDGSHFAVSYSLPYGYVGLTRVLTDEQSAPRGWDVVSV